MKKKVSIIACAISALLFAASCQTKHDTSKYHELILGKWVLTYEKQVNMHGQVTSENEDGIGGIREFRSDGTFTDTFSNGTSHTGKWSIENDAITIHYPSTPPAVYEGKITKLTEKNLELDARVTATGMTGYLDVLEKYERK